MGLAGLKKLFQGVSEAAQTAQKVIRPTDKGLGKFGSPENAIRKQNVTKIGGEAYESALIKNFANELDDISRMKHSQIPEEDLFDLYESIATGTRYDMVTPNVKQGMLAEITEAMKTRNVDGGDFQNFLLHLEETKGSADILPFKPRDPKAQGGSMDNRQGFQFGGGADAGAGSADSGAGAGVSSGVSGGRGDGGGNDDDDDDDDDAAAADSTKTKSFFKKTYDYLLDNKGQVAGTALASMAFPGLGPLLGIRSALENSPLGKYMGPYDETMIGNNPNQGPDQALAAFNTTADENIGYSDSQNAMYEELISLGYSPEYADMYIQQMV